MEWTVEQRQGAKIDKAVRKFRESTRKRFYRAVKDMEVQGPHPKGWVTDELANGSIRLKIDYRHRMIYEVFENVLIIQIIKVSTREGAYK